MGIAAKQNLNAPSTLRESDGGVGEGFMLCIPRRVRVGGFCCQFQFDGGVCKAMLADRVAVVCDGMLSVSK